MDQYGNMSEILIHLRPKPEYVQALRLRDSLGTILSILKKYRLNPQKTY